MKGTNIGEFEELVLLAIGVLDEAYGVSLAEEIERRASRRPSIGALHSALYRLKKKKFIESWEGGATSVRGGRRKRFYRITSQGINALRKIHDLRGEMFSQIMDLAWVNNEKRKKR